MSKHRRFVVYLYVAGVFSLGTVFMYTVLGRQPISSDQWLPLFCFTAFLVIADHFEVKTSQGGQWLPTAIIDLAVIVALGP